MSEITAKFAALVLWVFILATVSAGNVRANQEATMPHYLIMAAVSDNPAKLQGTMQPMAEYMARKLAPLGVEDIEVVVVESRKQMIRLLRDGRVDWVSETAYSAMLLEDEAGAEILLRKWKHGVPDYRSLIFTRRDSPIAGLQDLSGHTIAFQHPGSTTGYFEPAAELQSLGYNLRRLPNLGDRPEPGSLGFLFSGAEYNTVMWVHKKLIDAGVVSSLDWQNESYLPPAIIPDLKIIHLSEPIPRALELVRGNLDPRIKAAIREVLLNAHLDPDAGPAMKAYQDTTRFDRLDASTVAALDKIRKMLSVETVAGEVAP